MPAYDVAFAQLLRAVDALLIDAAEAGDVENPRVSRASLVDLTTAYWAARDAIRQREA